MNSLGQGIGYLERKQNTVTRYFVPVTLTWQMTMIQEYELVLKIVKM